VTSVKSHENLAFADERTFPLDGAEKLGEICQWSLLFDHVRIFQLSIPNIQSSIAANQL
jgi:hypothetical protein